jgi:phosphopantothenoylcysteine decarboxylase/phosphopantothenate--cysteine ligase
VPETARTLGGRRILLGISGGIAAYKTPELVRQLVELGADVRVVMTPAASRFAAPLALQTVSRHPVLTNLFEKSEDADVRHVQLARWADRALLAPATANILGKLAYGIADDPVTTVFLAVTAPTLLAPAMNDEMWRHPAVAESVQRLRRWGYSFVGPEEGFLAEGISGIGRMSEPETIAAALAALQDGQSIVRAPVG